MKKLLFILAAFFISNVAYSKTITLTKDNALVMDKTFGWGSVAEVTFKAKQLDARLESNEPLYLVIDSGGGGISAGLELIENLSSLNRPVHTVTLFGASMAFQTVQGLGTRYLVKDGTLMSHKARGGFYGEFPGQIDSRYTYWITRVREMNIRTVIRTEGKHTIKSYEDLIENEYWCSSKECLGQGFADAVAQVKCDSSLVGTREYFVDRFVWRGQPVEIKYIKDACPLNTGIVMVKIYVNGDPLYNYDNIKYFEPPHLPANTKSKLEELVVQSNKKQKIFNERQVIKGY